MFFLWDGIQEFQQNLQICEDGLRNRAMPDLRMQGVLAPLLVILILSCSSTPSSSQTLVPSEAYAMRHLRYDLRIRDFYWPKTRDPCLNWRGVLCENGHVVTIYLSGLKRNLIGMANPTLLLDHLQGLTSLRLLNATGFKMVGTIPAWIGQLSSLQELDLSSCSIIGPIPSGLGQLSSLQRLSLAKNTLLGQLPETIAGLTRLRFLDFSSNMLTGSVPGGIGALVELQELDLSDNIFTGSAPETLALLSSLRSLKLSENRFDGQVLGVIRGLINLTTVDLAVNNFTGLLLTGLDTGLQSLNISGNTFYGPLPGALASRTSLVTLDVSGNYLNSTVPPGVVSGARLDENCFVNFTRQRSLSDCQAFYAARGIVFQNTSSIDKPFPMSTKGSDHRRRLAIILGSTLGGVVFLLLILGLLVMLVRRRGSATRASKHPQQQQQQQQQVSAAAAAAGGVTGAPEQVMVRGQGSQQQQQPPVAFSVKISSIGEHFTLGQLQRATHDFSQMNLIRAGHSGDLYRGVLDGGVAVVVKRIEVAKMKKDLLAEELEVLGKASHTRLVPLLGHCLELDEVKFLVYKYMPNGDLAQALHKKVIPSPPADILQSLDWITRLKIAIGAAEALSYLHHECIPPLVHRDVQASSILLDDKFEVRLGSLSETRTQEGEVQPGLITRLLRLSSSAEQSDQGSAVSSCSYDVYCFGKVLLELVTGKLDISSSLDPNADAWLDGALPLIDRHNKEGMMKLVDPSLIVDEDLLEEVWAMAIVAKLCLNSKPSKRPQIRHVLKALENPQRVTREENFSASLRSRTSSHSSWNASLFGSWRHSSSENVIAPGMLREEYVVDPNRKHSGTSHSQTGSITGEQSFHRRPGSNEIFPEPAEDVIKSASLGSGDNNNGGSNNNHRQQQQQQVT